MITQEEKIENAEFMANPYTFGNDGAQVVGAFQQGFMSGVKWANDNPKSKYNVSDVDYVKTILESIIQDCDHITSGNIAHNISSIKGLATNALKCFENI